MAAAVYNATIPQDGKTVFAWDRDATVRRRLLEAFADRTVWRIDGPTVTGAGFRLAGGPVTARELLAAETASGAR
jgi:hypothetical protein